MTDVALDRLQANYEERGWNHSSLRSSSSLEALEVTLLLNKTNDMKFLKGLTKSRLLLSLSLKNTKKNVHHYVPFFWRRGACHNSAVRQDHFFVPSPDSTASASMETECDGDLNSLRANGLTDSGSEGDYSHATPEYSKQNVFNSDSTAVSSPCTVPDPSSNNERSKSCFKLPKMLIQCHKSYSDSYQQHRHNQRYTHAKEKIEVRDELEHSAHFSVSCDDSSPPDDYVTSSVLQQSTRLGVECVHRDNIRRGSNNGNDRNNSLDASSLPSHPTLDKYFSSQRTTIDIADIAADDSLSVNSAMLAVSFDQDYAQLIFMQPSSSNDVSEDDNDDDDEMFIHEELLGITYPHPASPEVAQKNKPRQPDDKRRDKSRDDANDNIRQDEWSVEPASIVIETMYTDWTDDGVAWSFSQDGSCAAAQYSSSLNSNSDLMTVIKPFCDLASKVSPALCGSDSCDDAESQGHPFDEPSFASLVSTRTQSTRAMSCQSPRVAL